MTDEETDLELAALARLGLGARLGPVR